MDWKCSEFKQLSSHELYLILRMRSAVFVVENSHIHLELDGRDEHGLHVFALDEEHGVPLVIAYARLLPGDEDDLEVTIDKVLTHRDWRNDETRDQLVAHALVAATTAWPDRAIHINIPAGEAPDYEQFGFRKAVGPFLEHGLPYISMAYRLASVRRREAARGNAVKWTSTPALSPLSPVGVTNTRRSPQR
jgi:predicted GNAT family N-acyltransferase